MAPSWKNSTMLVDTPTLAILLLEKAVGYTLGVPIRVPQPRTAGPDHQGRAGKFRAVSLDTHSALQPARVLRSPPLRPPCDPEPFHLVNLEPSWEETSITTSSCASSQQSVA